MVLKIVTLFLFLIIHLRKGSMNALIPSFILLITFLISGCSDDSEKKYQDLKSNNISVRQAGVHNLGKIKDKDAVPILIKLLKDEHSKPVRLYIIDALVEINETGRLEALIGKFKENDNEIQVTSSVAALIELLNENDNEIKIKAIDGLRELGSTDAVQPLIDLLNTDARSIKLTVLRALGGLKDDAAVPALTLLLNDKDKYVRYNAALALTKLSKN